MQSEFANVHNSAMSMLYWCLVPKHATDATAALNSKFGKNCSGLCFGSGFMGAGYLQKVWSLLCIVSPNLTRLADPSASESESNDFDRFWLLGSFDEVWEVKNWKEARGRLRSWRANKEHIRSVLRLLSRSLNRSMKCGMWTDFDSFSSCVGTLDSLQYYHDWIEILNVVDRASMCWYLGLWCCMAYLDHEWVLHDGINCL